MTKKNVCFPYEFTLLSNRRGVTTLTEQFVSPTNLHCSQTAYVPHMNILLFVSPTNLHCSQTMMLSYAIVVCLFPLRIYTALKRTVGKRRTRFVCFPYEFTLLSNSPVLPPEHCSVCFPYEFTLLSNDMRAFMSSMKFVSPTNLHCSQTRVVS